MVALQVDGKPMRGFVTFADGVRTDEVRPRDVGHLTNDMTLQFLHVSACVLACFKVLTCELRACIRLQQACLHSARTRMPPAACHRSWL